MLAADARLPRERPEPSTRVARAPRRRAKPAAMRAPRAVVPTPPAWRAMSLTSVSAKKLSDGLLVSLMRRSIGGESTLARTLALSGVRPARGFSRTDTSRASSASSRRAAANAGGFPWKPRPPSVNSPRLNDSALRGPTQTDTP
jgi:hypothetical protein